MTFEKVEYDFTLPRGYLAPDGTLHRQGRMREASTADELIPRRHPQVRDNPEYLDVVTLARVVTQLGTLNRIDEQVIERLFASDFAYLMDLYDRINKPARTVETHCPKCRDKFGVEISPPAKA